MKHLLLAGCVLLSLQSVANACNFKTSDSEYTRNVIRQNGGYPISDKSCALLNKHGLRLQVTTDASVLAGASVGWASVRVLNQDNKVSNESGSSTYVNTQVASTNKADELLYLAIRDAIDSLDFNKAISQVK
jgi:hypothetical protein